MRKYSNFERCLIAIFSAVLFAAVGFVVSLVLGAYDLIIDALPFMVGFGVVAGLLAYRYPKIFTAFLWFMP